MRASLEKIAFTYSKTAISFNILLVLHILCLTNIFIFRSLITSAYIMQSIINAVSFHCFWYMALWYKRKYAEKMLTLRKSMYMRASGASEKIFAFSHSKTAISFNILLVLQKLCRYKLPTCRLTCTDRFPNVPTKLRKSIIGGGGGGGG